MLDLAEDLAGSVEHHQRRLLTELANAASEYRDGENLAYATAVLECLSMGDRTNTCLVAARRRTVSAVSQWLAEIGQHAPVIEARGFMASAGIWDLAIVLGAGDWFPPEMLSTARAEEITLVHPQWVRDSHRFYGAFGELATRSISVTVREPRIRGDQHPDSLQLPAQDLVPHPDWSLVAASAPRLLEAGLPSEACKLAVLGGGYAVWLPVDGQRIRGLLPTARVGERVVSLPIKAVQPGAVLLLRLGGTESAALRPLVDSILGSQQSRIRALQVRWKKSLRLALADPGAAELERKVRAAGARSVHLQYWATEECLRPRDDRDFRALLEVLQLHPAEPYIDAGLALRRAHNRAGRELTQALEGHVEDQDFTELESQGMQELRLENTPGLAAMVAFRVIAISPDAAPVPSNQIRHPFRTRGAAWLE
ncbi:hypothetical protein [Actinoallomurus liliacearum]